MYKVLVRTECLLGDQKKINENTNNEYSKSHVKKYILKWNKVRLKDRKLSKKVKKCTVSRLSRQNKNASVSYRKTSSDYYLSYIQPRLSGSQNIYEGRMKIS